MQRSVPARLAALLQRHGIATTFPPDAAAETDRLVDCDGIDPAGLVDRTSIPFVTIDNPDSRDLDQALFIEDRDTPIDGARYMVYYALADGSFYAPPASALFQEALRRGVTQYFPGFAEPMLPPALSEGLVSLNPHTGRRAVLFIMALDETGACVVSTFERALIRSRAKLSYAQVQAYLDNADRSDPLAGQSFSRSLRLLETVGRLRIADASQRDVVRYDRQEVHVAPATDDPQRFCLTARRRLDVEEWNAQLSLLCNIEGARFLARSRDRDLEIEGIFRVHPPPTAEAIAAFARWLERLVYNLDLDPGVWRWRRAPPHNESLAAYIERLPESGAAIRISMTIQRQAMLLNRRAQYSVEPGRHHAIGTPYYSRFSAPMREIIGILTHYLALRQQQGLPAGIERELVDRVVASGNRMSDLQKRLTKDTLKLAIDDLLDTDLRALDRGASTPQRLGTLMGATPARLHVRLDSPPVDLKLYVSTIREQLGTILSLDADATRVSMTDATGRTRPLANLGGPIVLQTVGYDTGKARWILCPGVAFKHAAVRST